MVHLISHAEDFIDIGFGKKVKGIELYERVVAELLERVNSHDFHYVAITGSDSFFPPSYHLISLSYIIKTFIYF